MFLVDGGAMDLSDTRLLHQWVRRTFRSALGVLALAGCDGSSEPGRTLEDAGADGDGGVLADAATSARDASSSEDSDSGLGSDSGTDAGPSTRDPKCGPLSEALEPLKASCDGQASFGLPNPDRALFGQFSLSQPLVANVPSAVTVDVANLNEGFALQLWGASQACGPVEELLWTSKATHPALCASFTPTKAFTHLFMIIHPLETTFPSFSFPKTISVCAGRSCAQPDGDGRTPGHEPKQFLSAYTRSGGTFPGGYDYRLGAWGRLVAMRAPGSPTGLGETAVLMSGVFRMPADDPYGDAWYCIGEGSTIAMSSSRDRVTLKNVTRLPDCVPGTKSQAISIINAPFKAEGSGSLSQLNGGGMSGRFVCGGDQCEARFGGASGAWSFLQLGAAGDLGTYFDPSLIERNVTGAAWFYMPPEKAPFQRSCAAHGTVYYAPMGTTTAKLTDASDFVSCPGTPIADEEVTFWMQ